MIRYADGSDMMGSLRNPAGWNNVYGMRPTWGLVPSEPLGDSFLHQLATNGPMARCPKDLATLLSVQSGPDARQPHGLPTADFAKDMDAHGLKGAQIAWLGDWGLPFDDGIMDISERAVEDLRALGADVTAIDAPFSMDALWESWITLRSWTVASGAGVFYDDPEKRDLLKPAAIWEIERGFAMSAREVHQQSVMRSMWFKKAAQLFETYDAFLMPSAQVWPFPIDWVHPTEIAGVQMDTYHRWMQVVIPAGLIG
jgi:amidase